MAKRIDIKTLDYKLSLDSLLIIINKIKDLTKLDTSVIFRFSNDTLLLYSLVGNGDIIHAFKSHKLNIKDLFQINKNIIDETITYKIADAKRFVTSMTVFIKYMKFQNIDDLVDFKIYYNDDFFAEKSLIKNSKSKEITPGQRPNPNQNIDLEDIEYVMDTSLSNYSFNLIKEDFDYIKSKTVIEKDNEVLYLNIKNNNLSIGETKWLHNICEIEYEDEDISFPKKYFKCINYEKEKEMKIYVTNTYLLILGDNTNLLINVEFSL